MIKNMHEDDADAIINILNSHPNLTVGDLAGKDLERLHLPVVEAIHKLDTERFMEGLARAAAVVDSWPDWMKGTRAPK